MDRAVGGLARCVELPTDRPRPQAASYRGGQVSFEIPGEAARVSRLALEYGATPFMVLHAALAVVLARLSGTGDIAVATPIAGRGDRVLDPLIGMFVNTLVLRTSIDTARSFAELIAEVRDTDLAAFAHSIVPFEAVVDAVDPVRTEAFAPLAQISLTFGPDRGGAATVEAAGMQITPMDAESPRPN